MKAISIIILVSLSLACGGALEPDDAGDDAKPAAVCASCDASHSLFPVEADAGDELDH